MKVILDTNVLISTFVFGGNSGKVFDQCIEKHDVYISQWIFDELYTVLKNKFKVPSLDVSHIISSLKSELILHSPTTKLPTICRDKDDNHILHLGESVDADYIITGDKDLLIMKRFKGTKIISPAEYLLAYN